jgi:hypothetical protein
MSDTPKTLPDVFIIESLDRDDEKSDRFEGRRIQQMLSLSGKTCDYVYIRTKRELAKVMSDFKRSNFRYLHISCHGNRDGLATTYDRLSLATIAELLNPHLANRRVFISACSATTMSLAQHLLKRTKCLSVMGPSCDVKFQDAAILWTTFYHLMFKEYDQGMKGEAMRRHGGSVARLFGVPLKVFVKDDGNVIGYTLDGSADV